MIELIVFDLDGVLVDSEWLMARVWSEHLSSYGVDITAPTLIARFAGKTDMSMAEVIQAESGRALPLNILAEIRDASRERLQNELTAIEGADALLSALGTPKCICSNSGPDRVRKSLSVTNLRHHFSDDVLFSAAEVARPKPAPDLHRHAGNVLSVDTEKAVVIEDSVTGVLAAVAAGMTPIGFVGASHIADGHDEALTKAGAVSICTHLSEVHDHLAAL